MWWKSVWFQTHPYSYHSWGSPCSFFLPTLPSDSAKSARRLLSTISGAGWGALEEVWSRPGLGGLCGAISGTEPWFDRLCLRTGTEGGSPFILNFKIYLLELQWRQKSYKNRFSVKKFTPVFLITALDDYSENLPLRPSHFHTPRCGNLKFWFHIQFLILYKTR